VKQQLRVVAEVAGLTWLTQLAGILLLNVAMLPFSWLEVEPRWFAPAAVVFIFVICPCMTGFVYGRKRILPLGFWTVFAGWAVGWIAYSEITHAALGIVPHSRHHKAPGHPHWWGWPLWIGWLFAFSLLPTLVTMWGQRRRMRAAQPGD
jgi:hypothetical protein